jgi:bacillithiol biosynthesis deacetylase BshB1
MAVDILVFAPHPDDAELCCGGLLLKARRSGQSIGIVDFTRGEMGTRGSVAERRREAAAADRLLGVAVRENLNLGDGRLSDGVALRGQMAAMLRKHRPALLLAPHWEDQHPDHAAVGQASIHAAFLSGVPKFAPQSGRGSARAGQPTYRPRQVLHYNNRYGITADVVVDISDVFEEKLKLVACYVTQFGPGGDPNAPQTRLSNAHFFDWLRALHLFYGYQAGAQYGEAYCLKGPLCVRNTEVLVGETGRTDVRHQSAKGSKRG